MHTDDGSAENNTLHERAKADKISDLVLGSVEPIPAHIAGGVRGGRARAFRSPMHAMFLFCILLHDVMCHMLQLRLGGM